MGSRNEVRLYINGAEYKCRDASEAYAIALQALLPHIKHNPVERNLHWLTELWEMIYDKEDGIGSKMTASAKSYINDLRELETDFDIQNHVYDMILRKEKLHTKSYI